jgi:hypothetical protein
MKEHRREIQLMVQALEAQGWTVVFRPGCSGYRATAPGTPPIFFHSTPSDRRGVKNCRKLLERHGAKFGPPGQPHRLP